jgi:hypothetical protein
MNTSERGRIRTRRELLQHGYGPLYEAPHRILLKHNPISLDLERGDARDDYGGPVGTLIPQLKNTTEDGLPYLVWAEMNRWYREAGEPSRYGEIVLGQGMPCPKGGLFCERKSRRYRARRHRYRLLDITNQSRSRAHRGNAAEPAPRPQPGAPAWDGRASFATASDSRQSPLVLRWPFRYDARG